LPLLIFNQLNSIYRKLKERIGIRLFAKCDSLLRVYATIGSKVKGPKELSHLDYAASVIMFFARGYIAGNYYALS
jgi:hypothetical protein